METRNTNLLEVHDLKVHFPIKDGFLPWSPKKVLKAVDGVSFQLKPGETIGVVGESGCGKSTLARAVLRLNDPSSGKVLWKGNDLLALSEKEMHAQRQKMQIIFQDPLASLDPRMTVGRIIAEPLKSYHPQLPKDEVKRKVKAMMDKVGLLPNLINRYPHEFSGGQCQRIGIARALILGPELVVCDEPVSALDVSIQAQVINLLKSLQKEMNLTLLFIAHDLSVVKHISDRVLVMYLGNVVELADCQNLYQSAKHPYTKALLSAVPVPDPKIERNKKIQLLEGDLPSPISPPLGCAFHTRCPQAVADCTSSRPPLLGDVSHQVACIETVDFRNHLG